MHEAMQARAEYKKTVFHQPDGDSRYILIKPSEPGKDIISRPNSTTSPRNSHSSGKTRAAATIKRGRPRQNEGDRDPLAGLFSSLHTAWTTSVQIPAPDLNLPCLRRPSDTRKRV